jgi:translation initiation factor 3 subunit L
MSQNKVGEVRQLYQKEWSALTQAYYKESEWPRDREIAQLCDNNHVFLLCYNELYYRHIFVNGEPLIHHRFESWNNYRNLLDAFLDQQQTGNLMLPSEWVNDMVDEFLYQYQDFCRYKHELSSLSAAELQLLAENTNVWQTETVLGYLQQFVARSGIVPLLQGNAKGALHGMRVLQSMGYFSLFGLCRAHCLLADYRLAVDVLAPVDIDDKRALFTRLPACHINLFYYLGFAYLMMRRYADAVNAFSGVLMAHKGRGERGGSYAEQQINKRYDQIRSLTAMVLALSPGLRVDQQVLSILGDREDDKTAALARRDEAGFEKVFAYACPKFIVPSVPDFAHIANRHQSAYHLQLKWFLHEVRQCQALPTIRSYLKLYTSIPVDKLARFCNIPVDRFREHMLSLKVAANQVVHTEGKTAIEGQRVSVNDIHFFIVGDMVFIEETRAPQRYSEFFLTHAQKFQQAIDDLAEVSKRVSAQQQAQLAAVAQPQPGLAPKAPVRSS